jgi:hypothetical protein
MSDRKEVETIQGFATQNGLSYEQHDKFGLSALPFDVMRCQEVNFVRPPANCERIVYGNWKGNNLFVFRIDQYATASNDAISHSYHTAVMAPIPAECRILNIEPPGLLSHLGLSRHWLQTGQREFDHAFNVTGTDPEFARAVLVPALTGWLLANGRDWHFQLATRCVLMHRKQHRHDYEHLDEFLDLMGGFYTQIPDQIATQYPLGSAPDPELSKHGATGSASAVLNLFGR